MRITGRNLLAVAALAALLTHLVGCAPSVMRTPQGAELQYPSPLAGPGVPTLSSDQRAAVEAGMRHLAAGKPDVAAQAAAQAGDAAPALLLALEAAAVTEPTAAGAAKLAELTAAQPDYAAAWIVLSQVAEATGDEATALHAAARGAELWPVRAWRERADGLQRRLVDDRLATARELAAGPEPATALAPLDAVLAIQPDNQEARLTKAEVLVDTGRAADAAPLLEGLDTPRAHMLDGRVAEAAGDWSAAMATYQALPPDFAGRNAALSRARLRWRIANLPPYVQQAIAAVSLDRAQLAVLLVDLAPQIEGLAGTRAPLLSDIVELPSYREILTSVSTGLLHADLLDHRFFPERPASPRELQSSLERLSQLLGVTAPTWCVEPESAACTPVPEPVSGAAVTELVLALVAEATS